MELFERKSVAGRMPGKYFATIKGPLPEFYRRKAEKRMEYSLIFLSREPGQPDGSWEKFSPSNRKTR